MLNHLVAAGREADPSFAPNTASMLADTSLTRSDARRCHRGLHAGVAGHRAARRRPDLRRLSTWSTTRPDVQLIVRTLVARAPERLSIVFASRRAPGLTIAKLRAIGEVGELTTDDLRFDTEETARLFSESYGRALEPDVLADVAARTEGWAASLQLVHAALRDRTPGEIRSFVRGLSGADRELYDYLAEEVVGDLPEDLQDFLMRTAILQIVTPELAEVVTGLDGPSVARLTAAAERMTLLGRRARGPRTELRYHPLVRGFLEARLRRDQGVDVVRGLHRTVAAHAESRDWRVAAHHYWLADDRLSRLRDHRRLGTKHHRPRRVPGRRAFVTDLPDEAQRASFAVVLSRRDFKHGDVQAALDRAHRAVEMDPASDVALANLATLTVNTGDAPASKAAAERLIRNSTDAAWLDIGRQLIDLIDASLDVEIGELTGRLSRLAEEQRLAGQTHFEGITYLNLAEALRAGGEAAELSPQLRGQSSYLRRALEPRRLRRRGQSQPGPRSPWKQRRSLDRYGLALEETNVAIRADALVEAAELEAFYGDSSTALDYLSERDRLLPAQAIGASDALPAWAYATARTGESSRSLRPPRGYRPRQTNGQDRTQLPSASGASALAGCARTDTALKAVSDARVHASAQSARGGSAMRTPWRRSPADRKPWPSSSAWHRCVELAAQLCG